MKSLLRSLAAAGALVVMATSGALAEWKPSGPITMMIALPPAAAPTLRPG